MIQDFLHKKILLGLCGGIAAYKTAYLIRELTQLGAEVRVVMTQSAQAFITPLTLQALSGQAVRTDLFDEEAERGMGHIELARWADLVVIAPATANFLAKMAHGLADDLLSTLCLVTEAPVFVCPAMNRSMWGHPATQANVASLMSRGVRVVGPEEGLQACGEEGAGRMTEPDGIIDALRLEAVLPCLQGKKVLITAGPTQEYLDPVRYLTNASSGRMGYALANAARAAGADVTLISGPTALKPPSGIHYHQVISARELFDAVMSRLESGMIFIGCAAVGDYHVRSPKANKMKKEAHLALSFELNPDCLKAVAESKKASLVVGFAAETENVVAYATKKLIEKQVDVMIANQVGEGMGFHVDDNEVVVITKQTQVSLERKQKTRLAGDIINLLGNCPL